MTSYCLNKYILQTKATQQKPNFVVESILQNLGILVFTGQSMISYRRVFKRQENVHLKLGK